ncbi:AAA family ATPase [Peredibacter starrii]|uniref:AAA family ATPase n=1 Tax=Peredibacter starrii TaxID=28202 RepID=A0AAX4HTK9_9BACT|nr:AAA family ATPase [Peredibacter starrii]WPU66530.1 AAA family ATPase [Peredibacter starrii]
MAIASDVKQLFNYLQKNNLLTDQIVKDLQNADYCSKELSAGKYPVLLKLDDTRSHQEQRKFGTPQARYYDPETYSLTFKDQKYLFSSQLFEEQRKRYYSWLNRSFGLNPVRIISGPKTELITNIRTLIAKGFKSEILKENDYYYIKNKNVFESFKSLKVAKAVLETAYQGFLDSKSTFQNYLSSLPKKSREYELFEIIGKVVAHFDLHGFNKSVWNLNEDKRTLARIGVRQNDWVRYLINYKISQNDAFLMKPGSVKNTIRYIESPNLNFTILSDNQREAFSKLILGIEFDPDTFSSELTELLRDVEIPVNNPLNRNVYISHCLYHESILELWEEVEPKGYWVLGAWWGGDTEEKDQSRRFIEQSIWENGFEESSGDPSLKVVQKIKEGDFVALKSSYPSKDANGNKISCLMIKAIGEVVSNDGDGINLAVTWEKQEHKVFGLSYMKTAEAVKEKDIEAIFRLNNSVKGEEMSQRCIDKPRNVIFFGPPGTGKTHKLMNEIAHEFIGESLSIESKMAEVFEDFPLWKVIACTLIDAGKPLSVKEIMEHEFVIIKSKLVGTKTFKESIWGKLQSKTILESKTVNTKNRSAPYVFDKNENSEWKLAGDWKEELSDEIKLVQEMRQGEKLTGSFKRFEFVTFHPSFSYEDFMEGIKPILDEESDNGLQYTLVNGIFKRMCLRAAEDPKNNYAIFIDEINRGNIPSIFGELITLIEEDKRGRVSTVLPYSKIEFTVPKNLFIYGTMNTADKSVEALDLALRRRFIFEELEPRLEAIDCEFEPELIKNLFKTLNTRVEALLGKDFRIGHSYFMKEQIKDINGLRIVFENKIIPLLKEYFYEDWEKLSMVLGRKFVAKVNSGKIKFAKGYSDVPEEYQEKSIYRISDSKDWDLSTFKSIYED